MSTAISFMSESSDHYLFLTSEKQLKDIKEHLSKEWYLCEYLMVNCIRSDDHVHSEINKVIESVINK